MRPETAFEKCIDIFADYFEAKGEMEAVKARDDFYKLLDEFASQEAREKEKAEEVTN
jgi:hypothetical protein